LTAENEIDCEFTHWEDDLEGNEKSKTLTMNGDKNVTAYFTVSAKMNQPVTLFAQITTNKPDKVTLYYKNYTLSYPEEEFQTVDMSLSGDNKWEASLPASSDVTGLVYFIKASGSNFEISFPSDEPDENPLGVRFKGALDTKKMAEVFQMVSIPLKPDQTNADAVFSSCGNLPEDWVIYSWDGSKYSPVSTIQPGTGYWLSMRTEANTNIQIAGETLIPSEPFAINLKSGWNQIGVPYAFPIYLGNIQVKANDETHSFFAKEAEALIRSKCWEWEDSSPNNVPDGLYQIIEYPSAKLVPWKGYWVKALEDVQLVFSPSTHKPKVAAPARVSRYTWRLELNASTRFAADRGNVLGIKVDAKKGYDRYDSEKPPLPTDELSLCFPHPDWGMNADDYAVDIKPIAIASRIKFTNNSEGEDLDLRLLLPNSSGECVWNIEIRTKKKERVTVQWNHLSQLPVEYRAYLEDWNKGIRLNLCSEDKYSYLPDREVTKFKVRVTRTKLDADIVDFIPRKTALLPNYPNPFNPDTWIPYQLAQKSAVVIKIYDLTGRLVRKFNIGEKNPGVYSSKTRAAHWDGRNSLGEETASGVYFYELIAENFHATKRMLLVR